MKKTSAFCLLAVALLATAPSPARAVDLVTNKLYSMPSSLPFDPAAVPIIGDMVKKGGKAYYIGERSNLHGWFVLYDGHVQIFYVTSDAKTVVLGALYTPEGTLISSVQVKSLIDSNKDVSAALSAAVKEQERVLVTGSGGAAATLPNTIAADSKPGKAPSVSLSPGERLIHDLEGNAGVFLGKDSAPVVHLVISPSCSSCKTTWKLFQDAVTKGEVRVHMIPVGNEGSADENVAGQLLLAGDPLQAWTKYVDGDATALSGVPLKPAIDAVRANVKTTKRWNIQTTPYIAYRAKDGHVKIVQGRPEQMAAVLKDLGQ